MEFMKPIADQIFQIIYFIAYRIIKLYWAIRKPKTDGALIAVWYQGKILLVRNSYHGYYSLPGGYLRRNESAVNAAIRELSEETGIKVSRDELESLCPEARGNHTFTLFGACVENLRERGLKERGDEGELIRVVGHDKLEAFVSSDEFFPPHRKILTMDEVAQNIATFVSAQYK